MKITIQFFSLFVLLNILSYSQENFISCPTSVSWNTPFEISLIASENNTSSDLLEILIDTPDRLELKQILLNTLTASSDIQFSREGSSYKTTVNKRLLSNETNYQLLFRFKPDNISSAWIKFSGIYFQNDSVTGLLFNNDDHNLFRVDFYKSRKYSGKALYLKNGGVDFVLKPELLKNGHHSVISDFWFKTEEKDFSVLKIFSGSRIFADIFINAFGMLSIQSSLSNKELHPYFISANTWNHLTAAILTDRNTFEIYCNGHLISSDILGGFNKHESLNYHFGGDDSKEYIIDQLKFSDAAGEKFSSILTDRNFITPSDDIHVWRIFRFDDEIAAAGPGEIEAKYSGVKFIKSDAPVGLRSPDLNINILSSSFELEWSSGDYKQTDRYILEKSENNREFVPVYFTDAKDDPDAVYTFTDRISKNCDIVYYRVKQLLKDGSVLYSSQVKVGQGFSEPFSLGQNFPNPFNPKTSIDVELFRDSEIQVYVYNLEGKEVARIFDGKLAKGKHKFSFHAGELPSGVYICRVSTPDFVETTKMILTK